MADSDKPPDIQAGNIEHSNAVAIGPSAQATVIYQGEPVSIPSLEAVKLHCTALRAKLETESQERWGGMGAYIHEEGARLPIDASPYQDGEVGQREDLLRYIRRSVRLQILGEPGSGKTVALQRLAWELCGNAGEIVPVLVPLLFYAGTPLEDWVRALLQETGHLRLDDNRALAAFLHAGNLRFFFLFDGLNEVRPAHTDRLKDELVRWMNAHPRHAVIVTSRVQDESWRTLRSQVQETVVIQPIVPAQIEAYLVAGLGRQRGQALYNRLDARLRALAQRPLLLWLMKEAGAAGESLPGNRGELYARFVTRLLSRDTQDRQLDTDLPERRKRQAASCLACALQHQGALTCQRDEAVKLLAPKFDKDEVLAERLLRALARHGLLLEDQQQVRFPHQTLQEHFVAVELLEQARQEQALGGLARLARRLHELANGPTGLAALAADEWWGETFVQLAGLVDDPAWLVDAIARANPWLAWWCVEEGRQVDEAMRAKIEARSVRLLRPAAPVADRRRAVQTLAHMQSERVLRPLFESAADEDAEVARLAVQALAGMGEAVQALVDAALHSEDRHSWRSALRFLGTQPGHPLWAEIPAKVLDEALGQPMIWVPPGPFYMGCNKAQAKFDDELPQHEVDLPGYWIGRYPVTFAQFQVFLDDPAGFKDPRWWQGLAANDEHKKKPGEQAFKFSNHPREGVSWYDAVAFCRWLGAQSGLPVELPSEAEWEKAARGTDGRIYPWGDTFDSKKCNTSESGNGKTTPVGQYSPADDSPYGCADMSGNVWEWTRSQFKPYPYNAGDGRESLSGGDARVLRGGSWDDSQDGARAVSRLGDSPSYRFNGDGFRLVVRPPSLGNTDH